MIIFAVRTPDFRSFTDRRMIVSNGQFQHACNCKDGKTYRKQRVIVASSARFRTVAG
jgi:hypothetical protein